MQSRAPLFFLILSFWVVIFSPANAALSGFSQAPKKKAERKKLRARISRASSNRIPELKTAVLWYAPPYKQMASPLAPKEEILRDMQALEILSTAAEANLDQLKKAKRILNKKSSRITEFAKNLITGVSSAAINIDLHNYQKIRDKEAAENFVNNVNEYLIANYQVYKKNFFVNDMRNPKFKQEITIAREKLALICGEDAIITINQLFLGEADVSQTTL